MFVPLFMLAVLVASFVAVLVSLVRRPSSVETVANDDFLNLVLNAIRVESVSLDTLSHGDKFYMPMGELVQRTLVIKDGLHMAEFDGELCVIAVPMVNRVLPTV